MKRAIASLLLTGCGYHAIYARPASEHLFDSLSRVTIASGAAASEVLSGAREELARLGTLASGAGEPRLEIDVTGAFEAAEGIEVPPSGRAPRARVTSETPVSRATRVSIVVHGRIVRNEKTAEVIDLGDERVELVAGEETRDPVAADFIHDDTLRAAARRAGRRLAARAVGEPVVSEGAGR